MVFQAVWVLKACEDAIAPHHEDAPGLLPGGADRGMIVDAHPLPKASKNGPSGPLTGQDRPENAEKSTSFMLFGHFPGVFDGFSSSSHTFSTESVVFEFATNAQALVAGDGAIDLKLQSHPEHVDADHARYPLMLLVSLLLYTKVHYQYYHISTISKVSLWLLGIISWFSIVLLLLRSFHKRSTFFIFRSHGLETHPDAGLRSFLKWLSKLQNAM